MSAATVEAQRSARTLPAATKLAFGVGQIAEGIQTAAFNTFVIFYYNQVLGLSGTLSGIAVLIALCFDAVTDPIAGSVSDKLESRWGRRHPFIVVSALPLAVTFCFLFSPPSGLGETGLFLWLTAFAVLVRGSMTFYHIPHLALGAEMAGSYDDRSSIFTYSTIFGWIGGISCAAIAYNVFFRNTPEFSTGLLNGAAYPRFAVSFGLVMLLVILTCAWGTRKEIPHLARPLEDPPPFSPGALAQELAAVFRSRSSLAIFLGLFCAMVLSVEQVFGTYMGVHFWGLTPGQISPSSRSGRGWGSPSRSCSRRCSRSGSTSATPSSSPR